MISRRLGPGFDVQFEPALGIKRGIKPRAEALFLRRPAGLYVRFFVPTDLQALVGSRYLVRPVRLCLGDAARLAVARTAVALSEAFDRMRRGQAA